MANIIYCSSFFDAETVWKQKTMLSFVCDRMNALVIKGGEFLKYIHRCSEKSSALFLPLLFEDGKRRPAVYVCSQVHLPSHTLRAELARNHSRALTIDGMGFKRRLVSLRQAVKVRIHQDINHQPTATAHDDAKRGRFWSAGGTEASHTSLLDLSGV